MKRSGLIILALVAIMATIAGAATFVYASNSQQDEFESKVEVSSYEIADASQQKSQTIFSIINSLAITLSTYAKNTDSTTWPFETVPNFEEFVSQYRDVSQSHFIATIPFLNDDEKTQWEEYSVTEQGWITKSYQTIGLDFAPLPIPTFIYNIEDEHATEALEGPFKPLWQSSPPPKTTGVVNYNVASNPFFAKALQVLSTSREALLTPIMNSSVFIDTNDANAQVSFLVQPILEDASDAASSAIVGSIIASLNWNTFFTALVGSDNDGMVCVLQNSCGDSLTWMLHGDVARFLGAGDLHDQRFDEYVRVAKLTPFLKTDSSTQGFCEYEIQIYPSTEIQNDFISTKPAIYTTFAVLLFVMLGAGFMVYDHLVQMRQREAMINAARSDAIVQSLFPADIRDRLLKGNEAADKQGKLDKDSTYNELHPAAQEGQKFRLKTFLDEDETDPHNASNDFNKAGSMIKESKPIADLFPNTTVMFADIAGFTAWSSVREPSQVFTLLETVYKSFDKTAKRRKVFKVETVGDCYVAVTGLPEPLKDHAIVMCKFARECQSQFSVLVRQLEVILGPDTGDLAIRVGLHSGPVTAGVLRGEKSRFQLFGDTVNTAARIESTGVRNKIHLSHETAELLHGAGKSNWIRKRNDTVMAKGKGEMQTYWLLTEDEMAAGTTAEDGTKAAPLPIVKANAPRLGNTAADMLDPESTLPPRIKRLVDWNVDVLKRLLKQIVAKRKAIGKEHMDPNHPLMMKTEVNIGCDTYVLDEVTEIIRLPGYTQVKQMEDPNKIELPPEVGEQLRLYVSSIAAMHRDNAFHNFEHASHVMMSVSKLLSRIVAPDEVLKGDDEEQNVALSLHDHTYGITSDPLTQFSVVLAALIHDVDHAGVSNFQLIKEGAKIATVFKQKSVAEQNSIVLAWDRLMESRFTALRAHIYGDPDELKRFRQLMVNTVLATDIFDKELQALRKNRWDTAFRHISQQVDSTPEDDINRKATIVIEHLIQASDVAHTMQHWHIYQKWNERLFAEMTYAFQTGRMENNPADGWYKGELGFFDNYVIPLAKKLKECGVFGVSSDEYLNYALENRREWASKGEEVVDKMIAKYWKKDGDEDKEETEKQGETK